MTIVDDFIQNAFDRENEATGLFWRTSRNDTFVDLLMILTCKSDQSGLTQVICTNLVITLFKAMVNNHMGLANYNLSYKKLNTVLEAELPKIHEYLKYSIKQAINNPSISSTSAGSVSDYFKVLNNLDLSNYDASIFEDAFIFFTNYLNSNYILT